MEYSKKKRMPEVRDFAGSFTGKLFEEGCLNLVVRASSPKVFQDLCFAFVNTRVIHMQANHERGYWTVADGTMVALQNKEIGDWKFLSICVTMFQFGEHSIFGPIILNGFWYSSRLQALLAWLCMVVARWIMSTNACAMGWRCSRHYAWVS